MGRLHFLLLIGGFVCSGKKAKTKAPGPERTVVLGPKPPGSTTAVAPPC